ncbi:MAG: DNA-cytosine methyltransferase [Rhodanobacter sp. 68-29]|nr:endonuclease domain-containing protein [Rhodanobacter sp.]ODU76077.1 MAG: DNA-cytosine methyltransferase [Rhodanobacter sp. SCN 69-32]OJY62292.1 MAG: DNA-cytosine methyltransferase [Rhodanobacter sp. 68-29]
MQRKWERARRLRNAATDAERHLWRHLRCRQIVGCKFRRQYPLAGYIVDFVCIPAGLVLELDGGQHLDAMARDADRTRAIEALGYRVLRFWNDDVLLRTDAVLEEVWRWVELRVGESSTPPRPSPAGRGGG